MSDEDSRLRSSTESSDENCDVPQSGEMDMRTCVFCGAEIKKYPPHLPCDGVEDDGIETPDLPTPEVTG